jgi:putative ABC transport system substrate-binding protein
MLKDAEEAAAAIGRRLVALRASTESELEPAFATLVREEAGALMIAADPFFNSRRDLLVALAARYRVPTIYEFREFAAAGGLHQPVRLVSSSWQLRGTDTQGRAARRVADRAVK